MKEDDIRKREIFNRYLELVTEDIKKIFTDRGNFIEIDCPACGSRKFKFQFEKSGFRYVMCQTCQTLFNNPRPPFEELMEFYTKSRSTAFWAEEVFGAVAEARREKILKPRAEYLRENFPKLSKGKIGDIGAGFGIFLEELAKLWPLAKLVAIESSPEMAEFCKEKKLAVIPQALEDVVGWDGQFNLLSAFELFEQSYEPGKFIEKAYQLLKPGGYLFFTTLNGEGFDIKVLWEKSKSVNPPHHLNFFNPNSISHLLRLKGFTVKEVSTPGKLDWDIVEGIYKAERVDPGRFWRLVAEKATQEAKKKLQTWISESGFSSHMRIIAQKL